MTIEQLLAAKSLIVLVFFTLFFVSERLRPASFHPAFMRLSQMVKAGFFRLGRNFGLLTLNALLGPLIVLPLTVWASNVELGLRPGFWNLALDVLILDLWIYAWHRANHEIQFLWRFHQVHHLDEFLDTSSAFRFHFGEVVLSALVRVIPIVLLSIPLSAVILFEVILLLCAIFHHSNLKLPPVLEQFLAKLIVTPSIHWIHHHAKRQDTDSNYGLLFSFWDKVFRSKSLTARWPDMPIGVEHMRDRSLIRLLAAPLKPVQSQPPNRPDGKSVPEERP